MKRKLAFIMAAIMLVTTPASVLASEGLDVSVVSEDIISEDDNAYVEEMPAETTDAGESYVEETVDTPEASYEALDEAEAGPEDYDVIIEDGGLTEDSSADGAVTTEYGDDDFIVAIEEVPTTYSDVSLLDENDDNKCGENLDWELEGGVLTISGSGEMYDFSSKSDGTAPWFEERNSISSVNIGDGVTSIGEYAFYECTSLSKIEIPEGVTSVGKYAFKSCTSLQSVTIPGNVESIGMYAFQGCSALGDVYYDGNVEKWASVSNVDYEDGSSSYRDALVTATYHFSGESDDIIAGGSCGTNVIWKFNKNGTLTISGEGHTLGVGEDQDDDWTTEKKKVTAVVVEEGITGIYSNFFTKFRNMESIDLPDSLTFISDYVFSYCESLTSITIPDGVTAIYEETFYGCSSLETVNIPDNVDYIEDYVFYGCTSLKEIVIPDKVTEIQSGTFKNCTSLTKVTLPKNIKKIGSSAFDGCTSLADVYFGGSESDWEAISISSGNDPLTSAAIHYSESSENIIASGSCGDNLTWELDDTGVLTISGTGAMDDFSSIEAPWYSYSDLITSVIIEDGVTSICNYAFYYCDGLTSVSLPSTLESLGYKAFAYCSSLGSLELPYGITEVSDSLCERCTSLVNVVIPDGVTAIGDSAFYKCTSLQSVNIPDGVTAIGDSAFYECESLTNVNLPNSLTEIWTCAFDGCINLTSIEIPDNVTYLGQASFLGCTALASVKLPEEILYIRPHTFYGCTSLTEIVFPENVLEIRSSAFENCAKLTNVTFNGNNITSIEEDAFNGCTSLADVYYNGFKSDWEEISISSGNDPLTNAAIHYSAIDVSSSCTVTLPQSSYTYDGSAKQPSVTVKDGNTTLTNGTDYTVSYSNNTDAGTATVTVTGIGNYTGTISTTFKINAASLSGATVSLSSDSYTYNGSAKKPTVTVNNGGKTLTSGTDYTVSYSDNTNAGTATVKVTGKGNYTGSPTAKTTFTINKASQTLSAKASSSSIVKGKTATITASGKGTISYSSNKKSVATVSSKGKITAKAIGTAKITVKAAGNSNYKSASKTLTIKVIPKATTLSSAKSSSSKKLTVKWKKVSGVTGYQIQYSTNKNFKSGNKTATVSGASKVSKTISKLKKGKTYYVRVRTYKKVSGTKYYSSWTSKKKVKVK